MLKKDKDRLLTRAAQKHTCVFATSYRAATVRERSPRRLFQHPASAVKQMVRALHHRELLRLHDYESYLLCHSRRQIGIGMDRKS
jgi:hypothetical protein